MPTYLVHGFRWRRLSIITHIIRHNIEDAAADWIIAPATSVAILNSLYSIYDFLPPSEHPQASSTNTPEASVSPERGNEKPKKLRKTNKSSIASLKDAARHTGSAHKRNGRGDAVEDRNIKSLSGPPSGDTGVAGAKLTPSFNEWSAIKLVEQYDMEDMVTTSQPFAYVGDHILEVRTGVSISEEIERYESALRSQDSALSSFCPTETSDGQAAGDPASPKMSTREWRRKSRRLGWFEKLRDALEREADIGWFVVVCADEDRDHPAPPIEDIDEETIVRTDLMKGLFGRRKGVAK